MNEAAISQYITATFEGVDVVTDSGNSFFFYNPDKNVPPDHRMDSHAEILTQESTS